MTQLDGALCIVAAYFLIGVGMWLDEAHYYRWRGLFSRDSLRMIYGWPWILIKGIW